MPTVFYITKSTSGKPQYTVEEISTGFDGQIISSHRIGKYSTKEKAYCKLNVRIEYLSNLIKDISNSPFKYVIKEL